MPRTIVIGVDTNVLLRYLLRSEDVRQGVLATVLLEDAARKGEAVWVSNIVLCELIWTLRSTYKLARGDIVALLHQILARTASTTEESRNQTGFAVENRELIQQALEDYTAGRADFADYLIGRLAEAAGATTTYTFDRAAAAAPTFKLLRGR